MRILTSILTVCAGLVLGGCGEGEVPISNDRLIESHAEFRTGIWVSAQAEVDELLADQAIGGKMHQRFTIRPGESLVVQIRHSVDDSDRIPVQPGDTIRVQGYYQWDPRGGFVSRTFNAPSEPGGGGWVEHKGKRYD
jgi:hypothetical protein